MSTNNEEYIPEAAIKSTYATVYPGDQPGQHHVYLGDEIGDGFEYRDLFHLLRRAREHEEFVFYLGGHGGSCHGLAAILSAVRQSRARHIMMNVVSPCYSAHSELALAGTGLVMEPHSFLMFHNYSSFSFGKGGELMTAAHAESKWLKAMARDIGQPFLTPEEIEHIERDQDLYIHWDSKGLKARIQRHFHA